jgi:hypothetical protein
MAGDGVVRDERQGLKLIRKGADLGDAVRDSARRRDHDSGTTNRILGAGLGLLFANRGAAVRRKSRVAR